MKSKIKTAVIGSTGYTGIELVNLLSKHINVKLLYLCATKKIGKKISFIDNRKKKRLPKISSINKIDWNKIILFSEHLLKIFLITSNIY